MKECEVNANYASNLDAFKIIEEACGDHVDTF